MKIGPRIALATSLLVALTLSVYGLLTLRARRAELESDLERQTVEHALTIAAALEAETPLGPAGDALYVARQLAARQRSLYVVALDEFEDPAASVDTRARAKEVRDLGVAVQGFVRPGGQKPPYFALAFPVRRENQVVGVLELRRDASYIDRALREATLRMVATLVGLVAGLALAVALFARAAVTRPLNRMLQEIGEVAKGDLTRTVFAARDDEVGRLAERFNEMTSSLREAREETRRGVETRLGLEERLRLSEKLATVGQVSAEIAHEVGTPLSVIGGRARALERKAGDPDEVARNAQIIAVQASRISKIIQRLLDFARRRVGPAPRQVDLNRVVREAVEFLEHQIERSDVTVDLASGGGVASVPGDPDAIQQVCLNLIVNAVQAMPHGGRLEVATSLVTRRKEGLEAAAPTPYACLEVSDNGVGIAAEERARIFEPFYSTKEDGSGLGLAVSHGIVKDHDGWIEVEAKPGGGTVFRVFLPATGESLGAHAETA